MKLLITTQKVDENDDVLGFFHRWIEEFAKHCEQITVICLYEGEHHLPENVKVLSLGKEEGASRITYILRFYRYIWSERKNYDSVFVHMNQIYVILGGFFWRLSGKRVGLWYAHRHVSFSLRVAEKFTHTVFTPSKKSFRLKSDKLKVMGHGINTELFKPLDGKQGDVFRIVTVGRISPIKDYETLISAIEIIVQKGISIRVDIVGDVGTPEQKEYLYHIKEIIKEKKLENFFSFVGAVTQKELPKYLQRADIFVNMSHTGSLDKAILEAMSSGVIVVTCNESLSEILGNYAEMLMFSKKNVTSFVERINFVRGLKEQKKQEIKEKLRSIVTEEHNIEKLIVKIIKILK